MFYSLNEIICNQRTVTIEEILQSKANPQSPFEQSLFQFIREWLSDKETFTLTTSGSTGAPKEISLSRHQLQQSARRTIQALNLKENDAAFICLDTKYIAGKMMVVRAMEAQMKIIAAEPSANPLVSIKEGFDFIAFVPLQLSSILSKTESYERLNRCKKIIIGGASIHTSIKNEIKKLSCDVYATYGMTETVSHIALQKLNHKDASDYFSTLPGISITKDERNCLVIRLSDFDESIVTNDLVEILSPTTFRLLGRFDNIINSGGFKIAPEKIEKIIEINFLELGITNSFFVGAIPDERLGQKLIIVIEGGSLKKDIENLLFSRLKKELHPYEVPKDFLYKKEFIRTETGKIKRSENIGRPD